MRAWARAGWRVWDLGNGTIMLQKLFNPEWQITSKSFLLSSFLIGFSFSPTAEISRLELEFEESLPRKTASKRGLDRSQMEQPIKKNKFSYFARSRLRLHPQEIWEQDYNLNNTTHHNIRSMLGFTSQGGLPREALGNRGPNDIHNVTERLCSH